MKRIILAAALMAATMTTGARAETVWIGNVFVDSVTGPCTSTFGVGDFYRGVFRPRGAPLGNGVDSYLSLVGTRAGIVMRVPADTFKAGEIYQQVSVSTNVAIGNTPNGSVAAWAQTPPTPAANSPTVRISGTVMNFFRIAGCEVGLRGNLIRR